MVELLNVAMICRVQADVAQVVAHCIGSEEVTGPSPVISFLKSLGFQGFFHFLTNESRPFLSGFF